MPGGSGALPSDGAAVPILFEQGGAFLFIPPYALSARNTASHHKGLVLAFSSRPPEGFRDAEETGSTQRKWLDRAPFRGVRPLGVASSCRRPGQFRRRGADSLVHRHRVAR